MGEGAIQILCGGLGTLAYALFFHVRPRHLLLATLGGALSWLLYLLVLAGTGMYFSARWWPPWGFACGLREWPGCEKPPPTFL